MFKTTPFKKGKEGSKTIVGRIVEVEGKAVDENTYRHPVNNAADSYSAKSHTPVRKGAISASVSKIFGGSSTTSRSTSTNRTPGRKLLKKLICTPGKARSFPDTSVSDAEDFGIGNLNQSFDYTGFSVHPTVGNEQSKDPTSSVANTYSEQMASSPSRLSRNLLEDRNSNNYKSANTKSSINSGKTVDAALVAASNRSDRNDDIIFTANSTSSDDEYDVTNENERDPTSRLASSAFSSPTREDRQSSSSHVAMKSPGMAIPTPAMTKLRETASGSYTTDDYYTSGPSIQFPHPLRNLPTSPIEKQNMSMGQPKDLSVQFEEEEDDEDAFLPDDFNLNTIKPTPEEKKQEEKTFTLEEVEQKIKDARREERLQLRMQHEKILTDKVQEFEQVLFDSGAQWKKDSDEQEANYQKRLKEQERKVSKKHHELINKVQSLDDLKTTLKQTEGERDSLKSRVSELETGAEKSVPSNSEELDSLRKANAVAENRIFELESELAGKLSNSEAELNKLKLKMNEMDVLKHEKETTRQQAGELSERLRIVTKSNDQSQTQLGEAMIEIALLKEKLAELPSVDPEEIRSSKLEVENLRNLRAQDGKEIEELRNQLNRIVGEHQLSPQQKRGNNVSAETPCVDEMDMLRVDYNKAQDQLKSMGKILKRYKSERDDAKANLEAFEQQHIQSIAIAVKQATLDQKEKIDVLSKENKSLVDQVNTKDIGEQIVDEMKNHIEELKTRHEKEVAELRKAIKDSKENADLQNKTVQAQFETERKNLVMNHEKEVEIMKQYIQQIQTNEKDDQERLKAERGRIMEALKKESAEIIEAKTKECEDLEEQIKSMHEMHTEEIEIITSETRDEVISLKNKIGELEKELGTKPSVDEGLVENMKSQFKKTLSEVEGGAKTERDRLQAEIDSLKDQKNTEVKRVRELEAQIGKIQAETEERIEKEKREFDRQIKELRKSHGSESDELLAQLDLIEAEANQRCGAAEHAVEEKDAVITALGSQLADSESRAATATRKYEVLKQEFESLRGDVEVINASNEESQMRIVELIGQHNREMEDQIALREEACNEAREEMIALAEGQLAERQQIYQALKRELDNAQSKISVLERDLRFATKELEEMSRRHDGQHADLRDDLAQCRAALATKEANLIRAEKVHQVELDRFRDAERIIKTKYEESHATSLSLQKTLAATVREKQRIEIELNEVTAISEELATMLEKSKR